MGKQPKDLMDKMGKWVPDPVDLGYGRSLMVIEDYSKTVQQYSVDNIHFCALLYSILSWRETFGEHKKQFEDFLIYGYDTAEKILNNQEIVEKILTNYNFAEKKIKTVMGAAEKFVAMDITARMREDVNLEQGEEFREEIVSSMKGVGNKFASLFLRMSGYENIVPVDSWATKYVESRGYIDRHSRSGLKPNQYYGYENFIRKEARKLNITPALLQATIYATWSTWKSDSGIVKIGF